jgi:hypothetical protein
MRDRKYEAQLRAEEIASETWGCEFYDLPQDTQYQVYTQALRDVDERRLEAADLRRKQEKER